MSGEITRRGLLLVLSSPSGAGKTTITRLLIERDPELAISVSVTTRAARAGEVDGKHYRFVDAADFERMVAAGELLEHATVFGNRYGTPRAAVEATLARGRDIISDIDWQGTQQLQECVRSDLVAVFVLPPSMAALEERLRTRAQDSAWAEYDYVIVNRDLERSVAQVQAILTAERLKRARQAGLADFVNRLRSGQ